MKRLVETDEAEGLEALLGEQVVIFCAAYIYSGKLAGVNAAFVKLEDPAIVYETGPFDAKTWQDSQQLPSPWYVQLTSVESYGPGK